MQVNPVLTGLAYRPSLTAASKESGDKIGRRMSLGFNAAETHAPTCMAT